MATILISLTGQLDPIVPGVWVCTCVPCCWCSQDAKQSSSSIDDIDCTSQCSGITRVGSPYLSQHFKIVLQISSWSHVFLNFTLNKFTKACIPLKWIFSEICDLWYWHELFMWSDARGIWPKKRLINQQNIYVTVSVSIFGQMPLASDRRRDHVSHHSS